MPGVPGRHKDNAPRQLRGGASEALLTEVARKQNPIAPGMKVPPSYCPDAHSRVRASL